MLPGTKVIAGTNVPFPVYGVAASPKEKGAPRSAFANFAIWIRISALFERHPQLMNLGERLELLASRIAAGEHGRGYSAVVKLISVGLAKELLAVAIGLGVLLVVFAIGALISYGLDASGHGDVGGNMALLSALAIIVFIAVRFKSVRKPILLYFLAVFALIAIVIILDMPKAPPKPTVATAPTP